MQNSEGLKVKTHLEQKSDAPAELDQAEAEASDDRCLADPCPHDSPQRSGGQATSPDSAHTYSEEARQALIQCYDLLLQLARQDDAPHALQDESDTEPQQVESGTKEAVNG